MLEVSGLRAGYGRVPVISGVDFAAKAGEITLILGPNGAGKSTFLKTIAGFIRPSAGEVRLDGARLTGTSPEAGVRRGLRLVLDGHRVFPRATVRDNLRLGATFGVRRRDFDARLKDVFDVFPILQERLHERASSLSGGQQQMLALAQAFVAQPRVLLCDEPSLGLATSLMPSILGFLRNWAASGTAIVLVEQQIDVSLRYADQVYVMLGGAFAIADRADNLRGGRRIHDAYFAT